MNNRIKTINLESLIFFDIETASRQKELDINSKEFELYQYKERDRDTGELLSAEEVQAHYKKFAGLHPAYNQIVCISVAFLKGSVLYTKNITGTQKEILTEFYKILNSGDYVTTSYSGANFDIPVCRLKAYESGVEVVLNEKYNDSGKKPWEVTANHLDLYNEIKGTGSGSMRLDEVCFLFGIPTPKDDISGADVSRIFHEENDVSRIATYCSKDVRALVDLFLFLRGEKFEITEVIDKTNTPSVTNDNIFQTIMKTGVVNDEQRQEFLQKATTFTKKEKEEMITLIKAALADNSVMYSDLYQEILAVKRGKK